MDKYNVVYITSYSLVLQSLGTSCLYLFSMTTGLAWTTLTRFFRDPRYPLPLLVSLASFYALFASLYAWKNIDNHDPLLLLEIHSLGWLRQP